MTIHEVRTGPIMFSLTARIHKLHGIRGSHDSHGTHGTQSKTGINPQGHAIWTANY